MKKLLLAVIVSITLTACSSFQKTEIHTKDNEVTLQAFNMNESSTGTIVLSENEKLEVNYDITKGYVRIKIIADEQNETIYDEKNIFGKDTIQVQGEPGNYSIVIQGKDADGTVIIHAKKR